MSRKRTKEITLVLLGVSAVALLIYANDDCDDCDRYQYRSLEDCIKDWPVNSCRLREGYHYSPCISGSGSAVAGPGNQGEHALGVRRGGFRGTCCRLTARS